MRGIPCHLVAAKHSLHRRVSRSGGAASRFRSGIHHKREFTRQRPTIWIFETKLPNSFGRESKKKCCVARFRCDLFSIASSGVYCGLSRWLLCRVDDFCAIEKKTKSRHCSTGVSHPRAQLESGLLLHIWSYIQKSQSSQEFEYLSKLLVYTVDLLEYGQNKLKEIHWHEFRHVLECVTALRFLRYWSRGHVVIRTAKFCSRKRQYATCAILILVKWTDIYRSPQKFLFCVQFS